jgi:hypothetical protein
MQSKLRARRDVLHIGRDLSKKCNLRKQVVYTHSRPAELEAGAVANAVDGGLIVVVGLGGHVGAVPVAVPANLKAQASLSP